MQVFQNSWKNGVWSRDFKPQTESAELVIYFGGQSILQDPNHFSELRKKFPNALIVGCSTGGEIFGAEVHDHSLVLSAIQFQHSNVRLTKTSLKECEDSRTAGQMLGRSLRASNLSGILIFSDGTQVNGSDLVEGILAEIGATIPISGGLAGDGDQFRQTFVAANALPEPGVIAAVGFYGPKIRIGNGCGGGWTPFGPERKITRSKGNVLYELDGQPALALYKKYLGEEAERLPGSALLFPIHIRPEENQEMTLVRTVLGIDEKEQAMIFAGNIPEGNIAQLMYGEMEHLIQGAARAAQTARITQHDGDQLAFLVSCIGRKLLMGQQISNEVEAVNHVFENKLKLMGFYSYGEIAPHFLSRRAELHNQTMTITTLAEVA